MTPSRRHGSRKIIVYIAVSADGFIARRDGAVDWLDRPSPKGNYGMGAFYRSIDTVVMGRKTYDLMLSFGQRAYPGVQNFVFSRRARRSTVPNLAWVRGDVRTFVRRLRAKKGKHVWLVGGAGLVASFLDAGGIDEFSIHLIPTLIGEGIPLLAPRHRTVPLKLLSTRTFADGVVHVHYRVERGARSRKR